MCLPAVIHVEDKSVSQQDNKWRNDYLDSFLRGLMCGLISFFACRYIFQQWPERLFIFLLICLDCPGIVRRCLSRVLAGFKYARAFLVDPVHFFCCEILLRRIRRQITTTYYSATDMLWMTVDVVSFSQCKLCLSVIASWRHSLALNARNMLILRSIDAVFVPI